MKENIFSTEKNGKKQGNMKKQKHKAKWQKWNFYVNKTKFKEAIFYFRNTPKNYILKLKQMAKIQRKSSDGIFNIRQNIILGKKH